MSLSTLGKVVDIAAGQSSVRVLFTNRLGGVSRSPYSSLNLATHVGDDPYCVAANRRKIAATLAVPTAPVVTIRAEHANNVRVVAGDEPIGSMCDGLVSKTPNTVLLALAADCAPIVLFDPMNRVIGVGHCGWRGVVCGLAAALVSTAVALGGQRTNMRAMIGPTICQSCYRVDAERGAQFAAVAPAHVTQSATGARLDIRGAVVDQLRADGVAVELVGGCPPEDPELFSYRRDGVTGRHGVAVVLV
jgi:YfiH family protein